MYVCIYVSMYTCMYACKYVVLNFCANTPVERRAYELETMELQTFRFEVT